MAFSNKVIQQAIKEQMRGRVLNLNRIKREQQEAERKGKLECSWNKDEKGRLFYGAYIKDMYDRRHCVYKFYNTSSSKAHMINAKIEQYNNVHRQFLSQMSRNPNTEMIKQIQQDFDRLFPKINLAPDDSEKKTENKRCK